MTAGIHRAGLSELLFYLRKRTRLNFCFHPFFNRRTTMSQLQKFSNAPVKASSIIGTNVVNTKGDSLGDIKEVVIDPRIGRGAYVVVSFGGFFTSGGKAFG